MDTIEIHPSTLTDWMSCERSACDRFWNPRPHQEAAIHVAAWIGTAVHAHVLETEIPPFPSRDGIRFDRITATQAQAEDQVERMTDKIRRLMDSEIVRSGMSILKREQVSKPWRMGHWPNNVEMVARPDLISVTADAMRVIWDIKTSEKFTPAWLQLGAYALAEHDDSFPLKALGVIHCPRGDCGASDGHPDLYFNHDPEDCMEAARAVLERVVELIRTPGKSLVSPGRRCQWCDHPTCPVRAQDFSPR